VRQPEPPTHQIEDFIISPSPGRPVLAPDSLSTERSGCIERTEFAALEIWMPPNSRGTSRLGARTA
jgi:hypothetical protein